MMETTAKDFVSSILDAQKNMVDTMVENTKKMTNGNSFVNEAIERSTETYNQWMNQQKEAVDTMTQKVESSTETIKENASKVQEGAKNWFDMQVGLAKQMWEMNQNFLKSVTGATNNTTSNPMEWMMNMGKKMNETFSQTQNAQQWWNLLQQYSPANATELWEKTNQNWTTFMKQYNNAMTASFEQMKGGFSTGANKNVFQEMVNATAGFNKFYEIWMPFMKSIQENTFNSDSFKKAFDFNQNKELMDKFFGFMPDGTQKYFEQSKEMFETNMKQFMEMGKEQFQATKGMMNQMNPFAGQNLFENFLNGYQNMQSAFKNAVSPIARMATPNEYTQNMEEWANIADRMVIYNIKNAEMQSMMYQKGAEVMETLANLVAEKIENGVEIKSITELYQEFLKINDQIFTTYFNTDAYSKLMAETSAMQLKLKKDIELQTEKMLVNVPVATRSELDELYKVIYDLKKQVNQLQKMLDLEPVVEKTEATEESKTTKKTMKK